MGRNMGVVKLDRLNPYVDDDLHFEGMSLLFVALSVKNRHTRNGELTVRA